MTELSKRFDSDFPSNLFVIDPVGCGCTDCLVGYSTPLDQVDAGDLAFAVEYLKMVVCDRTGGQLTHGR